ncbi:putative inactive tyrosine-protein kinase Wsck isoform X2 [Eriocheir sinensis]|uniref:putative inactive tyrosine-protein kinase Wsck isoform X2 n=1 Tax=Eriocheir sinensis TaxID=95602 RepID=UPI0021C69F06|nr:putative inactive tyrosine-protein kinase Wsck isoform X2 [Eriocheir sinensis]
MWGSTGEWLVVVKALVVCLGLGSLAQESQPIGCYTEDTFGVDFTYRSKNTTNGSSISACVAECKKSYLRFAGLLNGTQCLCGNTLSIDKAEGCNIPCADEALDMCGGAGVMSVYETGHGILGPPQSLTQVDSDPSTLHITWEPPAKGLAKILHYIVNLTPLLTFSERDQLRVVSSTYSAHTQSATLRNVQPGSKYMVEVLATSSQGKGYPMSREMWTKVGKPETPAMPQVISRTANTITVQLEPVVATNGPITAYQVVVKDETVSSELQPEFLDDYHTAAKNSIPYYIAAQLTKDEFVTVFKVGDGKRYGKYYNAPLKEGIDYHILLGVVSTINDTKTAYSTSGHEQHESSHLHDFSVGSGDSSATSVQLAQNRKVILGLSIAIGIFGFLLVASIFVYIAMRVIVNKNRRSLENQELAVHAQQPHQDLENGYSVAAHYVDEEIPPADHYRQLKEKVWIIPHQGLNIVGDIGAGKFGDVRKGVVINKGNQKNVLVHRIEDDGLGGNRKTMMLREFDAHVRLGSHPHILALVGLMEEFNVISVAFEYETSTLKTQLVESRAVQHYPVYAEKNRRFSTLVETQAIEFLVGVAQGMGHLTALGVMHGQLCARNIVVVDGTRPKITGFGLIHYHNDLYVPDYRRWHAVETLRSKVSVPKSDVWSFGCLMWEVSTLGGTPYADVRTEEVAGRVMRGLRLPQPQYVGDELYQMMLNCWQHDMDERPSFPELEAGLMQLVEDDVMPHLLFSLYPSFQYEPYSPHLEFLD